MFINAVINLYAGAFASCTESHVTWKDGHETTQEEAELIDAERGRLESNQPIFEEINRLESMITNRRMRENALRADDEWLFNQDALIVTERAKLL